MEILNIEKLTDERWLNLFAARYRHQKHEGRWVFASRKEERVGPGPVTIDAVVIVAILHEEGRPPRLVMEREFRIPVGGWVHGLPAGLLEPGESVEETARRELREETGFEVTRVKRVSPALFSSCGMTDESAVLVFVDVRAPLAPPVQVLEPGEVIEVVLLEHADVCRLCDDPTARFDAKAWSVLYLYQQMGRFE